MHHLNNSHIQSLTVKPVGNNAHASGRNSHMYATQVAHTPNYVTRWQSSPQ